MKKRFEVLSFGGLFSISKYTSGYICEFQICIDTLKIYAEHLRRHPHERIVKSSYKRKPSGDARGATRPGLRGPG